MSKSRQQFIPQSWKLLYKVSVKTKEASNSPPFETMSELDGQETMMPGIVSSASATTSETPIGA